MEIIDDIHRLLGITLIRDQLMFYALLDKIFENNKTLWGATEQRRGNRILYSYDTCKGKSEILHELESGKYHISPEKTKEMIRNLDEQFPKAEDKLIREVQISRNRIILQLTRKGQMVRKDAISRHLASIGINTTGLKFG